jgi:hypothetical protein
VHRGFSDDVTELRQTQPGGDLLTDFQKDKFRYFFFHVLDLNADNVISSEDFEKLNEVRGMKYICAILYTCFAMRKREKFAQREKMLQNCVDACQQDLFDLS